MENTVFNIDCMELMKKYPNNYFDLAIIDPPYGINAPNMTMGTNKKKSTAISTAQRLKKGRLNSGGGKLKNRILNSSIIEWDNKPPSKEFFIELFRVSKNQIIFGFNYFDLPPTRCFIAWDKCQPWENFSQVELAWTSFDKPSKLYRISNTGGGNTEKKIHPTQKPVKLYDCIYRDFAKEGFKILDTHIGSGSNRQSADKYNCDFVGSEICKSYFIEQENRYKEFKQQLRLL